MSRRPASSEEASVPPGGTVPGAGGLAELEKLQRRLQRSLGPARSLEGLGQSDPEAAARLAAVRQAYTPPRGHRSPARIAKGIMAFRMDGAGASYPEIKYACYGVARPMDWEGRILLIEPSLLDELLAAVRGLQDRPRRFGPCYRGLLTAWLADLEGGSAALAAEPGAAKLKNFLEGQVQLLAGLPRQPQWAKLVLASGLADPATLGAALGL